MIFIRGRTSSAGQLPLQQHTGAAAPDPASFARPSYRPARSPSAIDPDVKRMGLIAGAIGGGLLVLVGGWSLLGHARSGVPVIEASAGPVRLKPLNPGGMQVTGAEDGVVAGRGQAEKLAPAAEQPQINALKAQMREVKKQLARETAIKAAPTPVRVVVVAPRAAEIAPAAPMQRASATARVPETRSQLAAVAVAAHATTEVQLAAYRDEHTAAAAWEKLSRKMPDLLGGRHPDIQHADLAGHELWRLRLGGFQTEAASIGFCAKVRARGEACSVAAF